MFDFIIIKNFYSAKDRPQLAEHTTKKEKTGHSIRRTRDW